MGRETRVGQKTILGDSSMVLGPRSASLGYNSLIFKDLHVVPKEPHPYEIPVHNIKKIMRAVFKGILRQELGKLEQIEV